jgi:P27 family predicted phage terminase small subunit
MKPPGHLSKEAKKLWRKILEGWELDNAALVVLESALESFDRMREAQAILAEEGIVVLDRFKQKKQHPATFIERDAKNSMLRALKQLNLEIEPLHDRPGRPAGR